MSRSLGRWRSFTVMSDTAKVAAERDRGYAIDIVEAAKLIGEYVDGKTFVDFAAQTVLQDAVIRRLEIIDEAAKCVSGSFKAAHSEVEWRKLARMRDLIAHHYRKVDLATVWDIARTHVPRLSRLVHAIAAGQTLVD